MPELDIVRDTAKKLLQLQTFTGEIDNCLWDRAQRLERSIKRICRLPGMTEDGFQVDFFCLVTSAYFSQTGLARSCGKAGHQLQTNLVAPNDEDMMELSALIAQEKLSGVVAPTKLNKISLIILECGNNFTQIPEAMILSDARSLDDMGAVGIFNELREMLTKGKGVPDLLKSWKRKTDYGYWQARLKESFHFEPVRKLAQQRLWAAEQFINQLNSENAVEDMEESMDRYAEAK